MLAETRDKVQRILTKNLNSVEVGEDGEYRVRMGSTACFVRIREWRDGKDTLVQLTAPLLFDVPPSPEVFHWAATEGQNFVFGATAVIEENDGTLSLIFSHSLLGTYLDEEELMTGLIGVVGTVDRLDDDLKLKFGGRRLIED